MKQTKSETEGKALKPVEYSLEWETSNLKADFLLEEVEGQLSLRVVYWFLITHGDVVEDAITGEIGGSSKSGATSNGIQQCNPKLTSVTMNDAAVSDSTKKHGDAQQMTKLSGHESGDVDSKAKVIKIAPRIRTSLKSINFIHDFHYVNRYRTFDEV